MLKKILLEEKFILAVIVANAVVIFIQGFISDASQFNWLDAADNFLTLIFMAEALVKIRTWGRKNYFASYWNIFDFALVLLALPSLVVWALPLSMIDLDYLLIFRIMRVFKFFRFLRFIPQIDHIINGVNRAASASVVIIFGFFIFNFIVSLVSCFLFREMSPEYFRDPLLSLYSIFRIFTVEGWYEIPDQMVEDATPVVTFFTRLYFVSILFIGGIFGLSLVNSILVDTMVSDNNDALEEKVMELQQKIDKLIEMNGKRSEGE